MSGHKRFADNLSGHNRATIDSMVPPQAQAQPAQPRVVTPSKQDQHETQYIHKPTAMNGGLTHASPLRPSEPLRYSLSKGKSSSSHRRASADKLQAAHLSSSESKSKLPVLIQQDPNAYKIFLLLLQPQSKIFELIQLIYSPQNTTVGGILELIPQNATEPALGSQEYIGLCRPKTQKQLLDMEQLASDVHAHARQSDSDTAKITLGEILVAIPQGYTGPDVASLSKQILSNPKIVKLLQRADPLAKRRRSSKRRQHRTKTRAAEQVHVLEKHDETDEELEGMNNHEAERRMKAAMEHALAEAAEANAAIPGGGAVDMASHLLDRSQSIDRHHILESNSIEEYSQQESLDESFSSWSNSFDASFSTQTSMCSGVSKRITRRKDRQARRMRILQRAGVAAFGLMLVFYWMDPHKDTHERIEAHQAQTATPMGLQGVLQCLFLLLSLYKVQRLIRTTQAAQHYQIKNPGTMPSIYMTEERNCPFLKASARALQKFKNRYAKQLRQSCLATGTTGSANAAHRNHDSGSYNNKLRSFSLKGAAHLQDLDATDTGSL